MSSSFSKQKSKGFLEAAHNGNLPLIKSLSLDPEVNLHWTDSAGSTPFSRACENGHVEIVRFLLDFHDIQRPIDYNLANRERETPFSYACCRGREKVVEMLLDDERIDVNRPDQIGHSPLYYASYCGHVGIVKRILASTREIETLTKSHWKSAADIAREVGAEIKKGYWESEEDFQGKKKGYFDIASSIESYEKDPQAVRRQLRRELGCDEPRAGELFALVIFFSDGFLKIPEAEVEGNAQRFFKLASLLPMDLQMVLCNRAFGLGDSIVKKIYSEPGFKKFARA